MPRNFYLEAQLKEAAVAAGALESSLPDWELDVSAYRLTNASEIESWVEKAKKDYPHRFAIQGDHDIELCQMAFVRKNLTAQMRLHNAVGEQRFNELKQMYANGVPENIKKKIGSVDHSKNPWAPIEANIDARGRYTNDAIKRQLSFARAAGPEKAAQVAASVSAKLGDLYAPGYRGRIVA